MDKSFDEKEALRMLAGKTDLFAELLEMFFCERSKMLEKIEEAIDSYNPNSIRLTAHAMKGPLNTLSASKAGAICNHIEILAEKKEFKDIRKVFTELIEEVAQFEEQAKKYLENASPAPKEKELKYDNSNSRR